MNISQGYIKAMEQSSIRLFPPRNKEWDESKHPRVPAGNGDESGQFTDKEGVGIPVKSIDNLSKDVLLKLKERGFSVSGINKSKTAYGESHYITVYDVNGEDFKVRISDHSVTNIDRLRNEIHISNKDNSIDIAIAKLELIRGDKFFSISKKQEVKRYTEKIGINGYNKDTDIILDKGISKRGGVNYTVERTIYKNIYNIVDTRNGNIIIPYISESNLDEVKNKYGIK